ncbi:Crp/Fnr family transcriptional regulator [Sphingomonas donggukensis]|uniref:Crp/Fnr family transcriptional regulator n=1 Tax=Sphingomonas donggukensis TaxID=2949093 RepID=A0ABY4TVS8_9SPHN|nr:Crp/Fnr family transcriptional regulator [Sphingomonas donggukensis]URW76074.1 Crp/Fnr family transcriptional regulator [Sphingomonas donggukensis]
MTFPLHRFEEFGELGAAEQAAVAALAAPPRRYARNQVIRREGGVASEFYLLIDGWVSSSVTLPSGGRQIMKFHLPGDALGTPSMSVARAAETLTALTPATVSAVSFDRFGTLLRDHPRVTAMFLLSCQRERVALMDWLTSVGRTLSEARLAALLIDLCERLQPLGLVKDDVFDMLVTQEQIGDALGLTAVHVNRTMRQLEEMGLIARDRHSLRLRDRAGLHRIAAAPKRALRTDLSWLPPAA